MSGIINIAGLTPVEDPAYRYRMPKIQAKVEGRGNGIKTVIVNVIELAQSLNRDAPEITKFFGCELGSQTSYSADTDRAVVNGSHKASDLQTHLSRYIEFFVLCKNCRLPETKYKIKGGIIDQKCAACGSKESCDMTHKLTTFILAQHKKAKQDAKAAGGGEKKDKKDKKKGDEGGEDPADGEKKEKKEKSVDKEEKKKKKKKKAEDEADAENGEDEGNLEEEESDSKVVDDAIERLRVWRIQNPFPSLAELLEELRAIQTFGALKPAYRAVIFVGGFFTEAAVSGQEIAQHKEVLAQLGASQITQRHLIAAVEWFCGTRFPSLIRYFPALLKHLFDEDLVEEDVFLGWAADYPRNEYSLDISLVGDEVLEDLRARAAPFITWVQEAEEDEEEGEEGEDEA